MMEGALDEALHARAIAERKFYSHDIKGARKFALKAQSLAPSLDGIAQMVATMDVHLAAEAKFDGESDWYGVLSLVPLADQEAVKKQYRKLALQLHPDKNKSVGAEEAFKLISEAWNVLSDKSRKALYDQKRKEHEHSVLAAANGSGYGYGYEGNKPGRRARKRAEAAAAAAAAAAATGQSTISQQAHSVGLDTFWTSCTACRMQYEYLRIYLNHNLLCPNCHSAFVAVETGYPCNGSNTSFSWPSKQNQQSLNHGHGSSKHSYGATASGATGAAAYQHDRSYDTYTSQGYQWSKPTGAVNTNAYAAHASEKYDFGYTAAGDQYAHERAALRPGRIRKRRRRGASSYASGAGHVRDGAEQWGVPNGAAAVHDAATGVVAAAEINTAARAGPPPARRSIFKDMSQVDIRHALIDKAKAAVVVKLDLLKVTESTKAAEKSSLDGTDDPKEKKVAGSGGGGGIMSANSGKEVKSRNKKVNRMRVPAVPAAPADDEPNAGPRVIQVSQPVSSIDVPDPDFHDFDRDRTEKAFEADQVWATYDSEDGMPRLYAVIQKVISVAPFKMRISFLNSKSNVDLGPMNWVGSGFPKTCGEFRVGRYQITETVNIFSHQVTSTKGARGVVKIVPKGGDTWALYRNWSPEWNELTPDDVIYKYEIVEVVCDYDDEEGVTVVPLVKVAGFKAIFRRHADPKSARRIPREEMFRFSHQVPSYLLTGREAVNAPEGCHELDPAATPAELLQVMVAEVK